MKRFVWLLAILCFTSTSMYAQSVTCVGAPTSRLVVGEQAQISADGGSNLRSRPSAEATLLNIIPQGEIIPIVEGPLCSGSYAWWQVTYNGDRGWVAEGVDEFYWLDPFIIQRAQISDIRIEVQPTLISNVRIERLTDPQRSQFVLEGYPIQSNQIVPFIVIFDETPETPSESDYISQNTSLADGERFVTLQVIDFDSDTPSFELIYRYSAKLDDGRFVDAYFPLQAPLPPYNPPDEDLEAYLVEYIGGALAELGELSAEDFSPTLTALDGIVLSLRYDAPIEASDLIEYQANGITFAYHPALATVVEETLVSATDTLPEHIQLTLRDFSLDNGIIRIYRAEDLPSAEVVRLQQIVQRQSQNPPQIPIPTQPDAPLNREQLQYMSFINGNGIRSIMTFADETQFYSYQGLTNDNAYFVSVLLPYVPQNQLDLLDDLISSLEING